MQALERAGLITVTADPADRRACFLTLTDEGRKHIQDLDEFGLSCFEVFVSNWSGNEIRTMGRLLAKLEAAKALVAERDKAQRAPAASAKTFARAVTLQRRDSRVDAPVAARLPSRHAGAREQL
jgi:DNA-binding PadR family transcriptional regulator